MNPTLSMITPFFAGFLFDLLLGDPARMPHLARLIGSFIQNLEPVLRGAFPKTPQGEKIAGSLLALLVPVVSLLTPAVLLALMWLIHPGLWLILEILLCYQLLAARGLRDESMAVQRLLENRDEHGDLSRARLALSRIVGRDTEQLNSQEIIRAAVETVAENTNDAVIAPMLFIAVGGGALGVFYKSVNTLDSMVGYENDCYRNFGAASARLDDICGFIPARLAAALMIASAWILRLDYRNALRTFKRDRFNHASPNSAQTESVCAGALGIRLGGGAYYGGVFRIKPKIGDDTRPPEARDILLANRLMLTTAVLGCVLLGLLRLAVLIILF